MLRASYGPLEGGGTMLRLLHLLTALLAACVLFCLPAQADWADDDVAGEDDDTDYSDDDTDGDDDSADADDDASDDDTGDDDQTSDDDDQTGGQDDDDDGGGCSHIASPRVPSMAIPVLLSGLATLMFLAWRRD